ncbi:MULTISPECIES: 4'-phosphopantetheinyl transferase family protein [Streptomyces]|uniref:4'-phosphopantetheinyl transferase family protein n=1 Tax=Streptomyces TaxID=1883 RepID=UPI00068CD229|nr:4'-phosphopantetheinyl transferase superfamily protein [Streptomyces sp. NRRL S-237]
MTAPGSPCLGPPLGEPIAVVPGGDSWDRVGADLATHGTALVHARLRDLGPRVPAGEGLRALLGRDWTRHLGLTHADVPDRHLASRTLLAHAASAVLDGDPADLELAYGPTGRPYLRGCDRIDISLGHTEDLLLVGLTTRGLIGVEVERADRDMHTGGPDRPLCTPYESVLLAGMPQAERNDALVRLWTLKEAYGKAIGRGTRLSPTEFGFGPDGRAVRVRRPDGTVGTGDEWTFRTFPLADGHVVGAAVYDVGAVGPPESSSRRAAL